LNKKFHINPRDEVSVRKAILIGYLFLGFIPFFTILGGMAFAIWLENNNILSNSQTGLVFFSSFIFGWILWSVFVTNWKIWAYSKVKDLHKLKRKSIEDRLIWPDGSWFLRTEIVTKKQKIRLQDLERRF
jgi:hypothetical protein